MTTRLIAGLTGRLDSPSVRSAATRYSGSSARRISSLMKATATFHSWYSIADQYSRKARLTEPGASRLMSEAETSLRSTRRSSAASGRRSTVCSCRARSASLDPPQEEPAPASQQQEDRAGSLPIPRPAHKRIVSSPHGADRVSQTAPGRLGTRSQCPLSGSLPRSRGWCSCARRLWPEGHRCGDWGHRSTFSRLSCSYGASSSSCSRSRSSTTRPHPRSPGSSYTGPSQRRLSDA